MDVTNAVIGVVEEGMCSLKFCKLESVVLHSGGSIFQLSFRDGGI